MLDLSKTAASSFTAQIADLGELPAVSVSVSGQSIGASGTVTASLVIPLPKAEAIVTIRVNYAGVTYSNFQNFWIYVPNTTLLNSPNTANYSVSTNRVGLSQNVVMTYKAGSGGHTLQAHTVTAIAHAYLLPF